MMQIEVSWLLIQLCFMCAIQLFFTINNIILSFAIEVYVHA